MIAVCEQRLEMVEDLLREGAQVDSRDEKVRTPLHIAAGVGNEDIVRLLSNRGANVDAIDSYGQTPLHFAAINGHERVALLLLDNYADIDARDSQGSSPLYEATNNGHNRVVELLISRNADVNLAPCPEATLGCALQKLGDMFNYYYSCEQEDPTDDLVRCITVHIIKLHAAGLYLNGDNLYHLEEEIQCCPDYTLNLSECRRELERIIDRKLNKQVSQAISLCDASITCNVNQCVFSEESIEFLETIDYSDFPVYGNFMQSNLNNIKRRRKLISAAKESFHALNKRTRLPSEILERIFCELRNRDLNNLISCCRYEE